MKARSYLVLVLFLALPAALFAGSINGKVSGVSGVSVVYVDAVPGKTFTPPAQHFLMDQKGLLFQPHILAVPVGSTVDFLNSDSVQHNVFWPSVGSNKKAGHNLGTWPKGQKHSFKFDLPGEVALLCNVHPEMSGYIIVVPTPYFAETGADGSYKIKDVPDGSYSVTVWHEGAKSQSKKVTVSGEASLSFAISK
ncbi:MAG: plastocyanin/azurin family copper-binding protein [Acidobacteriota bacterium]|nr:plastocyanin/azurin family copper-binding protein [Acidobacteriota bacterium]